MLIFILAFTNPKGNVMAGKRLTLDDVKKRTKRLSVAQLEKVKGGFRNIPSGSGSVGLINWDGVDIREENEGFEPEIVVKRTELLIFSRRP